MDQYVSWYLPAEELTLDTIQGKFEEFFKPQSNEMRAHFDLLTSFRQGNKSVDDWYNAVQPQVNLARYPQKQLKSCTGIFSGFSCEMKNLYLEKSVM